MHEWNRPHQASFETVWLQDRILSFGVSLPTDQTYSLSLLDSDIYSLRINLTIAQTIQQELDDFLIGRIHQNTRLMIHQPMSNPTLKLFQEMAPQLIGFRPTKIVLTPIFAGITFPKESNVTFEHVNQFSSPAQKIVTLWRRIQPFLASARSN